MNENRLAADLWKVVFYGSKNGNCSISDQWFPLNHKEGFLAINGEKGGAAK